MLAEFGTGQVFWSMLWFFLFVIWIWILVVVFGDIIRSRDLGGWGKALWTILIVVLPYIGVFAYMIARGNEIEDRALETAQERDAAMRSYVHDVSSSSGADAATELARLADLRDKGVITDAEFAKAKARSLA